MPDRTFGWSLPPGCSLSAPGGPDDPAAAEWERVMERLANALYDATRAEAEVREINELWAEMAEQAHYDEVEERLREDVELAHYEEDPHA